MLVTRRRSPSCPMHRLSQQTGRGVTASASSPACGSSSSHSSRARRAAEARQRGAPGLTDTQLATSTSRTRPPSTPSRFIAADTSSSRRVHRRRPGTLTFSATVRSRVRPSGARAGRPVVAGADALRRERPGAHVSARRRRRDDGEQSRAEPNRLVFVPLRALHEHATSPASPRERHRRPAPESARSRRPCRPHDGGSRRVSGSASMPTRHATASAVCRSLRVDASSVSWM